jgi:radical SAM protein with 4Fe4S-binding SPASM domain
MKFGVCDSLYNSLEIQPDGAVYQSGRPVYLSPVCYGSIENRTLVDMLSENANSLRGEKEEQLQRKACFGCRLQYYCFGGLDLDKYMAHESFVRKDAWCTARLSFIENYLEPLTGVKLKDSMQDISPASVIFSC